jgi:hypothetical protein
LKPNLAPLAVAVPTYAKTLQAQSLEIDQRLIATSAAIAAVTRGASFVIGRT